MEEGKSSILRIQEVGGNEQMLEETDLSRNKLKINWKVVQFKKI